MSLTCLNYREPVDEKHCGHCGQSAATARFTMSRLLRVDLAHVILPVDGSFFFTLKQLIRRPGHLVREYVAGRRVSYQSPLAMLAVLIIAESYLRSRWGFDLADAETDPLARDLARMIEEARSHHEKLFLIGLVPVQAGLSYLWFRGARQNYGEHFVLNLFAACTALVVSILVLAVIAGLGRGAGLGTEIAQVGILLTVALPPVLFRVWIFTVRSRLPQRLRRAFAGFPDHRRGRRLCDR